MHRPSIAWSNKLPGPIVHPLTTNGTALFAVAAGNVYALDTQGLKRWTSRIQASGPAVVTESGLLVPREDGRVALLDPDTGKTLKETDPQGTISAAPAMIDGVIAWTTTAGWLLSSDGVTQKLADAALTDFAHDGERIYVGALDGQVFAVDRSGMIWATALPSAPLAHPVLGPTTVYVAYTSTATVSGGVAALSRDTGKVLWTSEVRGGPAAAPALGPILVVPARGGELVGIDPGHGGVRWKTPGYGGFTVQPAISGGMAYAGNADGRLHRVDLHDGGEAWAVELGATVTGEPVFIGDRLFVGLANGRLLCLE
jgi:outer membrane protein assembly factor BamB